MGYIPKAIDGGEAWLTVGERTSLIHDQYVAGIHLFENGWVFDDDASFGTDRDGTDDRDRD